MIAGIRRWVNAGCLLVAVATTVLTSGCVGMGANSQRMARYRPYMAAQDAGKQERMHNGDRTLPASSDNPQMASEPVPGISRVLRKGDRLVISLKGIPRPEDITDALDDDGGVNLPLLGTIKIEGMTTAAAESAIEAAYIKGGIYRQINVIVVAQDQAYFIRGEVYRPGQYPLSKDVTLLMAIAAAGGMNDYANARRIRIIRGDKNLLFNTNKIEAREEPDPLLEPNDIIVVEGKLIL